MLKAVIFDLDGTLLDTSADIHRVLNDALARFSLPQVTLERTVEMVGDGAYKLIERAVPAQSAALTRAVYEYYVPVFAACDNSLTRLYDGEDAALRLLKSCGVKLAVLTNKPQKAAEKVCADKLGEYGFDIILGQTDRFPLKPDPSAALCIAASLGVQPEECAFCGDGETDVRTAANAGMFGVAALWGYRKRECLESAGAKVFAKDFTQNLQILQKKFSTKT